MREVELQIGNSAHTYLGEISCTAKDRNGSSRWSPFSKH
jgi:hypothetical protein